MHRDLFEDEQKAYDNFIEYVNCSGADDLEQQDIIEMSEQEISTLLNQKVKTCKDKVLN